MAVRKCYNKFKIILAQQQDGTIVRKYNKFKIISMFNVPKSSFLMLVAFFIIKDIDKLHSSWVLSSEAIDDFVNIKSNVIVYMHHC